MTSNMTRKRIVMAMSGGVDSSVAAYLLHHQINTSMHSVMGLHMNNWNAADVESIRSGENCNGNGNGGTTRNAFCVQSEQDANDAERICDMFGMKYIVFPLRRSIGMESLNHSWMVFVMEVP